ncbi:MAG: FapA family protein [Lachnospiraceae bacterium]|nr:FapA family protein [Lachnospiraceae bacterium]
MENKDACFKIIHKENGVFLQLIPAEGKGRRNNIDEIQSYLYRHNIYEFGFKEAQTAARNNQPAEILLPVKKSFEVTEEVYISCSSDNMTANITLFPHSENGGDISKIIVLNRIKEEGITVPIEEEVIDKLLTEKKYCVPVAFAHGIAPENGKDAEIVYMFNTDKNIHPHLNEDGTVDFHNIENINNVVKDQLLAKLIPEIEGKSGMDVYGKNIKHTIGKKKKIKTKKNVYLSEDGLEVYSSIDGHVRIQEGAILVSDVYEVKGDVGVLTGNIDCNGDVHVKGSILTGFKVRAGGSVFVDGLIEGAIVDAGCNVIVKRGITGNNKGAVTASGDIVAKFIENANVSSDGNITADTIMHSNIFSHSSVIVTSKKGFIVGGKVRAIKEIRCILAGSVMETQTVLQIGRDVASDDELKMVETAMNKCYMQMDECLKIIKFYKTLKEKEGSLNEKNTRLLYETLNKYKNLKMDVQVKEHERLAIINFMEEEIEEDGYVVIEESANVGVRINISGANYYIRREMYAYKYFKEGRDIVVSKV